MKIESKEQQQQEGRVFTSTEPALVQQGSWDSLGHLIVDCLANKNAELTIFIDFNSGRSWKGSELNDKILNVASALVDLYDFKPGTAVCVSHDNSDLSFILSLGVIVAGGVVACAYPKDPYAELLYLARKVEPKFLFCHEKNIGWAKQIELDLGYHVEAIAVTNSVGRPSTLGQSQVKSCKLFTELLHYDHRSSSANVPVACEDLSRQVALITMSSGTTGKPKAVPMTHRNCIADMTAYKRSSGPQVHMACCASLDYVSGRIIAFGAIHAGYSAVILNGFEPKTMLEAIEKFKIHIIYLGVASFYNLITYKDIDNYDISSVRVVFPMGAKMIYLDELRRFFAKHPHIVQVKQGFGASETSGGAMRGFTPDEYLADCDNCGHLLPGVKAKIVDPDSGRLLGPNQEGILHIRGQTVFPGYYDLEQARQRKLNNNNNNNIEHDGHNPKQTEPLSPFVSNSEVFDEDGFYITGDIAYFTDQEQLYFVGRKKELMSCRGAKKVLPQELEEVVSEHPAVFKVCVLGMANKREPSLHCPRAFVVAKAECYRKSDLMKTKRLEQPTGTGDNNRNDDDDDDDHDDNQHEELTYSGMNRLCTLPGMRDFARDLMDFVNDRVGWEKQLTGGIVVLDELPTSRATGKVDKNYLRSLTTDQIEIYGDRSGC